MPIRLLLIEDSDDDALLIQGHFRRADIEVDGVRVDTAEGLAEAFQAGTPDVVICDYNMPSFSAHEALQQVRMVTPDVPFILVSGQVGEEAAAELMRAGANDFVLKGRLARLVPAVQRELRDANERRQRRTAQSALRVSEERFRLLAEHAQDIIFRYRRSPEPGLEYVSPAVEHITGFTPDELYADHELIFDLIEPDDRTRFVASWRSADPAALTVRWRGRDGTLVYLEQRATTVTDEEGVVVAVEGILRDTTDQTLAEEDRRRLEHQLRQNERLDSLGHLAGGVAHDFNNLLAVVSGYCDVLAEDLPPDSPNVADVDCIRKAAERGASLTRQLLIFSRLEPSRTERLNLNTVVAETRDLLSRTLGEDISVATVLADDVRPVQDGTGPAERRGERPRGDARRRHADHRDGGRRRPRPADRHRRRSRDAARRVATGVRAVLHHPAQGRGHRPGVGHRVRGGHRCGRHHRSGVRGRRRHHGPDPAARRGRRR
jgi:PAS domain S-box-containing protein